MNHPKPIKRWQLIVMLLCVTIIPPTFVVTFVATSEAPAEPKLDVDVTIGVMQYKIPNDRDAGVRLMSSVKVTNPTSDDYRNVTISLNKEFFYYHREKLVAGGSIELPQEFFITKGGGTPFQTGSKTVNRVTVYAQIPNGARAVAERYFDDQGQPVSEPE